MAHCVESLRTAMPIFQTWAFSLINLRSFQGDISYKKFSHIIAISLTNHKPPFEICFLRHLKEVHDVKHSPNLHVSVVSLCSLKHDTSNFLSEWNLLPCAQSTVKLCT